MRKHLVIPDSQVTPDTPTDHLTWIGKYIVEKKPDVVVHLGDFADMESLSSYDYGTLRHEGKKYQRDITAANQGMDTLMAPLEKYNSKKRKQKGKLYNPEKHLTLGNHEYRIVRAVESDGKLEGAIGLDDLAYESYGWQVHDYREVVEVDGIAYSHFFYNPQSGRPYGGQSIDTRLKNIGFSFVMGHQQVYMVGSRSLNNGQRIRGLVCGSCYLHDEDYRGPQANGEWRGIFMLHEVCNGDYGLLEVSLDFLCRRYTGLPLWQYMEGKYPDIFNSSIWMQRQKKLFKEAA